MRKEKSLTAPSKRRMQTAKKSPLKRLKFFTGEVKCLQRKELGNELHQFHFAVEQKVKSAALRRLYN